MDLLDRWSTSTCFLDSEYPGAGSGLASACWRMYESVLACESRLDVEEAEDVSSTRPRSGCSRIVQLTLCHLGVKSKKEPSILCL